jgi:hypothetical protein
MLRIGGNRQHGLGRDLEQEIVDHRLVLVGDIGDGRRQRDLAQLERYERRAFSRRKRALLAMSKR